MYVKMRSKRRRNGRGGVLLWLTLHQGPPRQLTTLRTSGFLFISVLDAFLPRLCMHTGNSLLPCPATIHGATIFDLQGRKAPVSRPVAPLRPVALCLNRRTLRPWVSRYSFTRTTLRHDTPCWLLAQSLMTCRCCISLFVVRSVWVVRTGLLWWKDCSPLKSTTLKTKPGAFHCAQNPPTLMPPPRTFGNPQTFCLACSALCTQAAS